MDGIVCLVEILDTCGEEIPEMLENYIKNSDGVVIVYSITSKSTFVDLEEIRSMCIKAKDSETFPCILVGNKMDLQDERVITKEEGDELSKKWGCTFIESSAKTRMNIDELYQDLLRQIMKKRNVKQNENNQKKCLLF